MADPPDNEEVEKAVDPVAEAHVPEDEEPITTEPLRTLGPGGKDKKYGDATEGYSEKEYYHDHATEQVESRSPSERESIKDFEKTTSSSEDSGKELERIKSGKSTKSSRTADSVDSWDPNPVNKNHKWYHYLMFKRKHVPPVPRERTVSREYGIGWLNQITFWWVSPLMMTGWQRPLELNDLWLVNPNRSAGKLSKDLNTSFRARVARGDKRPLLGAMHETFRFEFWLGGMCQLTASVVQVINPFILRFLISFAAEAYYAQFSPAPPPPIGRGIGLVFCVTILQMIQSMGTNQFMYRGMLNGGQARAALIALIFDKSMTISGRAKAGGKSTDEEEKMPDLKPGSKEEQKWFEKILRRKSKEKKPEQSQGKAGVIGDGQGWSNGRIINLMSVDTYRIDVSSGMFHMIWTAPIAILITLVLLIINITYSALAGFGLLAISMPILGKAINTLFKRRKAINQITDQRVSLTQEILSAVRFVKYFGWETSFLERVENVRSREIRSIQTLLTIRNGINAISMSMPTFASMLAFICYALTAHNLNPAYIFSSLALFNAIRLPMNFLPLVIGQVVDAASSVARIQEFLLAEDAKDECEWDEDEKNAISVKSASFTWERIRSKDEKSGGVNSDKSAKQELAEAKAAKAAKKAKKKEAKDGKHSPDPPTSPPGEAEEETPFEITNLNFSVARGELVAVIGEVGSGKSSLLAALAGDMRKTEGSVVLGASRAFCPQYPWIQNASVQENILFGREMNEKWYNSVVDACALRQDLDMLPAGDMTEIGEKGITVSGGQKQRLNIARAIYFDSDILILDDPLSAVDAHVGRHIMDNAICGLLKHKSRVLATHQLWVLSRCDRIIWMKDGQISEIGTFDQLMAENQEFVELIQQNAQEEKEKEEAEVNEDERKDEKKDRDKKKSKKAAAALMQTEERATDSVKWDVYGAYIRSSGSILVLPLVLFLLILSQGAMILASLWLSWWTSNKFGLDRATYIGVYAAIGAMQAFLTFLFSVALSYFGTEASKVMLHRAITRVLRAPMSFFDTTPLGRITNRFSKDVDTMDNNLSDSFRLFTITSSMIISVFVLIIAYYYYFAAAMVPLFCLFLFSAGFYRASAREIKRHEAVLRSTVFARFSEAVTGVSTIRAYGLEDRFSKTLRAAVDDMNSAYFMTFANQRWLSVRLDIIAVLLVFIVGILVVTSRFSVNPSTGGLVLSYILSIVQMIMFTVRQVAELENNMNATERIHYYGTQLEEEAPLKLTPVPDSWPQAGEIVFDDVQMRYRDGLPLVLQGLTIHIKAGERIGIVGRTGAGKSSIMSTLFRLVELSGGRITIDGVDIATVGLADLRSRLAIIPQDPTLFRGTVRSNLDPFGRYSDLALWNALRQADLVGRDENLDAEHHGRVHLDAAVEEEGLNFSLGQRQLMALARALVRNAQIIVCDEATSSVDMATDERIQAAIRKGFRGKTLLCIAHRLKTIVHYDRIVVMDEGRIAEIDTPIALFDMEGGIFRGMCDRSQITRRDFEIPEGEREE